VLPTAARLMSSLGLETFHLKARGMIGEAKYGTPLRVFNGRSFHRDLEEELLDAIQYAIGAEKEMLIVNNSALQGKYSMIATQLCYILNDLNNMELAVKNIQQEYNDAND
jgi:hypothetical protein